MASIDVQDRRGLRTRALMEFLLGTGLRIFEALSLNRDEIDWKKQETKVIGKGNKERKVYITDRAKEWVDAYLETRKDDCPALFVTFSKNPIRLKQFDLSKLFRRYVKKSGIRTHVTPHVFRHTAASIMLRNGCDIRYIQEILGHSDIKTTVKYYIRVDKAAVKAAHKKFLKF
jgi:integrase/recombinase XerD